MFKTMSLMELAAFWNEDWDKKSPELADHHKYELWTDALSKKADKASGLDILTFLHLVKSEEYVEEIDNIRDKFKEEFFYTELQQIAELRVTVDILLEHHRHNNANVSIGQLENLKQREMHQGRY